MKVALSSIIDRIETQNRRIQNRHAIDADPLIPDFRVVDFNGGVLSEFQHDADEPNVERYCICVVPQGTFIDADRQRVRSGSFRLPCVDAMFPSMSQERLDKFKLLADVEKQAQVVPGTVKNEAFTSQAEIAAARAEAKALREAEEAATEQERYRSGVEGKQRFMERVGTLMGQAWHNGKRLA